MKPRHFHLLLVLVSWTAATVNGQTCEVRVVEAVGGGYDSVSFQIRQTGGASFVLATSSFVLNYSTAALDTPMLLFDLNGPWDNIIDRDYHDLAINGGRAGQGFAGLTVEFTGGIGPGKDNDGAVVPTSFTTIGVLRFPVINPALSANLSWRSVGSVTQVFKLTSPGVLNGGQTNITAGAVFIPPNNTPLPIQLSSFTATVLNQNQVRLNWTTLTETNNYGFEVQKSSGNQNNYQTIPNSFIPGYGTTIEPHSYSYVDNTASVGLWYYRLKQIDLDATVHFTEGIQVDVLTGVKEKPLPKEFALDQNYPNPFNPSTNIEYAVPRESRVRVVVYNILGQQVATLVDEVKSAGYYTASFNGTGFSSGLYFYRMTAGEVSFLKKMTLVK